MKDKAVLVSRILLGLLFVFSGVTGLAMALGKPLMPMPPMEGPMVTVMAGFMAMKYLLPLVKILEIVAGLLLLSGRYVNLAIVLLGPIVVNIFGIHLFAERSGLPMGVFVVVLFGVLLWSRWDDFKVALKA